MRREEGGEWRGGREGKAINLGREEGNGGKKCERKRGRGGE